MGKRLNLRFERAAELFREIPEIEEDMEARPRDESAMEFAGRLLESDTPEEAITICAYNFPRRHSVWWAHECLQKIRDKLSPEDHQMLALASAWVAEPDEERRRSALEAAQQASEDAEFVLPGTWIAFAAGWSGGSMVGPDLPEVPPPPHLTAKAVNAGILTSLAAVSLNDREATLASFVKMARQLAEEG